MSPDSKLQRDVLAELNWDPRVPAGHIGVTANGGLVTLTGHTENYADKHAAEVATRRVRGVRGVTEQIEVHLNPLGARTDEDITAAIVSRLSWDPSIPKDAVVPTVENGWVTLTGEVRWHFEKKAVEQHVERMAGVIGVSNEITIKPRVNAGAVEEDITHALHRSWFFDPKLVTVNAEGGTVKLSGTVPTYHDRRVAEETAWASSGTVEIENMIIVA